MAWVPKVNRHVSYLLQKTVGGNTNYVKRRPAIITAFATDTNPRLRVRHIGETYGSAGVGVPRKTSTTGDASVAKYASW